MHPASLVRVNHKEQIVPHFKAVACALASAAALTACQPVARPAVATAAPPTEAHSLAQAACGGCHAVEAYGLSPNPASPEFAAIANRPGVTATTLASWLRDAHNYPEEMDFYLEGDETGQLVSHILSLRRAGYRPAD